MPSGESASWVLVPAATSGALRPPWRSIQTGRLPAEEALPGAQRSAPVAESANCTAPLATLVATCCSTGTGAPFVSSCTGSKRVAKSAPPRAKISTPGSR